MTNLTIYKTLDEIEHVVECSDNDLAKAVLRLALEELADYDQFMRHEHSEVQNLESELADTEEENHELEAETRRLRLRVKDLEEKLSARL